MIKKSTLIVLACAIVLGGAVYYFQWRSNKTEKQSEDTSKPAFSMQADDVTALTLSHPGKVEQPTIQLANHNGKWEIAQPLDTGADTSSVRGIVDGLASARIAQTEPGTPDRLKAYGLDSPHVEIDFQLKNGAKHKIVMGDKDFTDISVYSLIDSSKSVSLLPVSLYTSADKSVSDLRDQNVLHLDSGKVASFDLKNATGELAASKQTSKDETAWNFTKPSGARADTDGVSGLISAVANGKFTKVLSEKDENLGKYGLASPAITFSASEDGGQKQVLLIGKKEGDGYFARDASRPTIFIISGDLYKKLTQTFGELRDKTLMHITENDVNRIELHNANATMDMARKQGSDFDWNIESPAEVKGKSAATWKVFNPLTSAKAEEVIDHPSAEISGKLSKPAIEVDFTEKNGTKLTVKISGAAGDFVYAQTSAGPSVFKLKKSILDDLNFKPSEVAS